ncbi:unnamed protein product [Paramecium pentaurelia]|uniref:Transmembrane protein n=1 Tax=Paramecium pentaurelia TaxID=43138 RepID=A0A8S1X5R4_9CILI|nr:unnamed protein product [Paramecium pentaurelia]
MQQIDKINLRKYIFNIINQRYKTLQVDPKHFNQLYTKAENLILISYLLIIRMLDQNNQTFFGYIKLCRLIQNIIIYIYLSFQLNLYLKLQLIYEALVNIMRQLFGQTKLYKLIQRNAIHYTNYFQQSSQKIRINTQKL